MKKVFSIILIFWVFAIFNSCSKNKKKSVAAEQKTESENSRQSVFKSSPDESESLKNYYQFQIRQIPAEITVMENSCDLYSVYLYETETDSKHFVTNLYQNPSVNENGFSWYYPGGGMFYEVLSENNILKLFYGETPEGKDALPWKDEKPVLEIKIKDNLVSKESVFLEIPQFSRTLKYDENKQNLSGEDVFYIQEILLQMTGYEVFINGKQTDFEPDGYFGKITEAAVKEYQKMKGLEETGVVDKKLWDIITKKENITR